MNITNQHMRDHVRDLHDFHNTIFNRKNKCSYNAYNRVQDLLQSDRYTVIQAFIQDIDVDDSVEEYLEFEDMQLVKMVVSTAVPPELLYDAIWKCSYTKIEDSYDKAVESLFKSLHEEYYLNSLRSPVPSFLPWSKTYNDELLDDDNKQRARDINLTLGVI